MPIHTYPLLTYTDEFDDAAEGVTYCREGRCACIRFRVAGIKDMTCECGHHGRRHNALGAVAFSTLGLKTD